MTKKSVSFVAACVAMLFVSNAVQAGFQIATVQGGGPAAGATYANFNSIVNSGDVDNGITVSWTPDGGVVTGAASGLYAPPYLSGLNGDEFGQPGFVGADNTKYLTSGRVPGSVTLAFTGLQGYLGLLWGSIDDYNALEFFNGNTSVGFLTGLDASNSPNGDQGVNGTRYVNITADLGSEFDRVVATSTQYAFEFDNVAYGSSDLAPVPEATSLAVWSVMGGIGFMVSRRRKKSIAA